jgi:hypothetical protein
MSDTTDATLKETAQPLPSARVLSYITNLSTPTRVRRVASVSLWALATLQLTTAGLVAYPVIDGIIKLTDPRWRIPGGPPTLADYWWAISHYLVPIAMIVVLFLAALALIIVTPAVKLGHRKASLFALASVIPLLVMLLVSSALCACTAVILVADLFKKYEAPSAAWAILPVILSLVLGLLGLLVIDLQRLLLWIARHPQAEKGRTPFLPAR